MFRFQAKFVVMAAVLLALLALAPVRTEAAMARPVIGGGGTNPSAVWALGGCSAGIILAGWVANVRDNGELTAPEAWTCGLLFWFEPPAKHVKGHHRH